MGTTLNFFFDQILTSCWNNDIITVVAAGNDGLLGRSLDESTPQKVGTANNGLITVGGVKNNGVLDLQTTYRAGLLGSMTVYAVSKNVVTADFNNNAGSLTAQGTSFAAPAVAGLAAYFAR